MALYDATSSSPWGRLNHDLTTRILSHLPLPSLLRAAAVCKHWRLLISDPYFQSRTRTPWLFLYGQNNIILKQNQSFGFDPNSNLWIRLPDSPLNSTCFSGSGGFVFWTQPATRFAYSPVFGKEARVVEASPLSFPRLNPLVGVFSEFRKIVVVGGARFAGGLVDIEDRLAVEIYDTATDSWELGPPLPLEFRSGSSSQWLCSCTISNRLLVVFGIFSNSLTTFDLVRKEWTWVRVLRPPGILFSYLVSCRGKLVLAGLCNLRFVLWEVEYESLEYREIGKMPMEVMGSLFDGEDDDGKFASLKCVGLDGVVYVYNEDGHKGYPACVCEIGDEMKCRWMKVPPLPGPVNRFHKVVAFCSDVPLRSVSLGGRYSGS